MRSSGQGDVATVLLGRARASVLRTLIDAPAEGLHLREVARRSSLALATAQRELRILGSLGLVRRTTRLRHVLFDLERAHPAIVPLRMLVMSRAPIEARIGRALAPIARELSRVLLTAPVSAGPTEQTHHLIVAGRVSFERVHECLAPLRAEAGLDVRIWLFEAPESFERVPAEILRGAVRIDVSGAVGAGDGRA